MLKYVVDRGFQFSMAVIGVAGMLILLENSGGVAEIGKTLFGGLGSTVATLTDRNYRSF